MATFNGAAIVFAVADMNASLAYYRNALGFAVEFQWGTPCTYACLCRGEVSLHLISEQESERRPGQGHLCIFVDDVDAVLAEISTNGARVINPPADYAYGMRDFDVLELDGNRIDFGAPTATT